MRPDPDMPGLSTALVTIRRVSEQATERVAARPPERASERPSLEWHPEPELLNVRDAAVSRRALREAGAAIWEAGLSYLYDHAFQRAMGEPISYQALRREFFGTGDRCCRPDAGPADL